MRLSPEEIDLVERIANRLMNRDPAVYRAGGRAVALQAIEHRSELVKVLRGRIAELGEERFDERRQGYHEALLDVLLAAEAALEPREQELRARHELAAMPVLQEVLDLVAIAPLTPTETAQAVRKSPATGGRYLQQLRRLGLLMELPTQDGRERPHRITPLGARLARPAASTDLARESLVANDDRTSTTGGSGCHEAIFKQDPLTGALFMSLTSAQRADLELIRRGETTGGIRVDLDRLEESMDRCLG